VALNPVSTPEIEKLMLVHTPPQWLVEAPALRRRDCLLPARRGTPSVNADVRLAT